VTSRRSGQASIDGRRQFLLFADQGFLVRAQREGVGVGGLVAARQYPLRGVDVVAEPGQVQGDLVGDLGGADAADGGVEVAASPRSIASGAARPPIGSGTTFS
jgi:hypothetical protein